MTHAATLNADFLLDRELMRARTPRVPDGLAARIVSEATRLPQLRPIAPRLAPVAPAAKAHGFGGWLQAASVAALLLISATTATVLMRGEANAPASADRLAVAERVGPAAAAQVDTPLATRQESGGSEPARRDHASISPQETELAQAEPVIAIPTSTPELAIAQAEPVKPAAWSLPQAPKQVYGPVEPPSPPTFVGGAYGSGAQSGMAISGGR